MTALAYAGIDWLTFSFNKPTPNDNNPFEELLLYQADDATKNTLSEMVSRIGFKPKIGTPHKPYGEAIEPCEGVVLMYSHKRPEAIVELQGKGCRQQPEWTQAIARATVDRITRIDLCADFETTLQPFEVCKNAEVTTRADMDSQTGQTVYLGSPKSERFVRVYRYAPPHPRSQFLRVEIVYRREYAKKIIGIMAKQTMLGIIKAEIERLKLDPRIAHAIDDKPAEYQLTRRATTGEEKTVLWLAKQVAPAIKKLIDEGYPPDEIRYILGLQNKLQRG
jgi:DNA relaxase NicK